MHAHDAAYCMWFVHAGFAFCVCSTLTVWLLTYDTKVTFDFWHVLHSFDVVAFTCLFQFAMCFVFTDCPVLCSLLLSKVLIALMFMSLNSVLWIGVLIFGCCSLLFLSPCFSSLLQFWEWVDLRVLLCYFLWDESTSTLLINYLRLRVLCSEATMDLGDLWKVLQFQAWHEDASQKIPCHFLRYHGDSVLFPAVCSV